MYNNDHHYRMIDYEIKISLRNHQRGIVAASESRIVLHEGSPSHMGVEVRGVVASYVIIFLGHLGRTLR